MSHMKDELNPKFLFQMTHTDLVIAIANGTLDAVKLAKDELANRGLNSEGFWIGFTAEGRG